MLTTLMHTVDSALQGHWFSMQCFWGEWSEADIKINEHMQSLYIHTSVQYVCTSLFQFIMKNTFRLKCTRWTNIKQQNLRVHASLRFAMRHKVRAAYWYNAICRFRFISCHLDKSLILIKCMRRRRRCWWR